MFNARKCTKWETQNRGYTIHFCGWKLDDWFLIYYYEVTNRAEKKILNKLKCFKDSKYYVRFYLHRFKFYVLKV